jgi:hypothetical protein
MGRAYPVSRGVSNLFQSVYRVFRKMEHNQSCVRFAGCGWKAYSWDKWMWLREMDIVMVEEMDITNFKDSYAVVMSAVQRTLPIPESSDPTSTFALPTDQLALMS